MAFKFLGEFKMKEILLAKNANHNASLVDKFISLKKKSIIYRFITVIPIIALILLSTFGYNIERPIAITILLLPAVIILFDLLIKMDKKIDILFELIVSQEKDTENKKDGIDKQS